MDENLKEEIYNEFQEINTTCAIIQKKIINSLTKFNHPVYQLSMILILNKFLKNLEKSIYNVNDNKELKQIIKEIKKIFLTTTELDEESFDLPYNQFVSLANFKMKNGRSN